VRRDPLQLDVRRISGGIDFRHKTLEEAAPAKNPNRGEIPRESGHGLELFGDHDDLYLMEIDRPLRIVEDATEFLLDPIFHSLDSQRMAKARVKQTDVRP